ncbi:MAG: hypothetical protein FJX20_00600 [Alphaproteobacteria bacterium]|nr:hypothetical protein [Alphaproteobacteria bacterium]
MLELRLVDAGHRAAVDLPPAPTRARLAEAFPEAAAVLRRIAEDDPDDLGVRVGQRALGDLPDRIGDGARLVEQQHDALAQIVQAGERLGVVRVPGDAIAAPGLGVTRRAADDRRLGQAEPVPAVHQVEPLHDLRPGLGAQLLIGIGGDHAHRILEGRQRPELDPGHQRRLADAVARSDGDVDRLAPLQGGVDLQALADLD